jgi:sugar phosphate isomerase/epimerase
MTSFADRLQISEITTKPWSLEQDVASYRRHGLGIELWESKFSETDYDRQISWIDEQGISISSLQPRVMTVCASMSVLEPKDPKERLRLMCRTVDRFAKLLKGGLILTNTGADPTGNEDAVWKASVEAYKRLADYAAERNVRVAFEPLGASLMNRSTTIPNIRIALQLLEQINHPNFGLCADSYNLWESSALHQVSLCGDQLFLVHLADWKRPRSFHHRFIPGERVVPLHDFLDRVRNLGYTGPYVIELFSEGVPNSLWEQDLDSVVERSKRGVLQAAARAGFSA